MITTMRHLSGIARLCLRLTTAALVLATLLISVIFATQCMQAQTLHTLHAFRGPDGGYPWASLIRDSVGNLYGTTYYGGNTNCGGTECGVVFKLSPKGKLTVLHAFTAGSDGDKPLAGLIRDAAGNLYGTTQYGGSGCNSYGCGTVFKVDKTGKETVLHSFTGADGGDPMGGVVRDEKGNLYGTTSSGTIFELDTAGVLTTLYTFTAAADGLFPTGSIVRDAAGNLYGTTYYGGTGCTNNGGCGTVYKLGTNLTLTTLHYFDGRTDGYAPFGGLIADAAGNLYGTTSEDENYASASGTVFEVGETTGSFTVLHFFNPATEGGQSLATLARDVAGNLYGANSLGGGGCGTRSCGTIWKLDTNSNLTVLTDFGKGNQGKYPRGGVVLDKAGNIYGTTTTGGSKGGAGTVFKITP
jgi:uncharacterized repeat protein (TIGR03803 family)